MHDKKNFINVAGISKLRTITQRCRDQSNYLNQSDAWYLVMSIYLSRIIDVILIFKMNNKLGMLYAYWYCMHTSLNNSLFWH